MPASSVMVIEPSPKLYALIPQPAAAVILAKLSTMTVPFTLSLVA